MVSVTRQAKHALSAASRTFKSVVSSVTSSLRRLAPRRVVSSVRSSLKKLGGQHRRKTRKSKPVPVPVPVPVAVPVPAPVPAPSASAPAPPANVPTGGRKMRASNLAHLKFYKPRKMSRKSRKSRS